MKKIICFLLAMILLLAFASCQKNAEESSKTCSHEWQDATCQTPRKCSLCGITEGDVSLTHSYEGDQCKHCGLVQLTLYNYEDYIQCGATVGAGDSYYNSYQHNYVYMSAECSFEATGNSHYKYNNVSIVIRFNHYNNEGYKQYLLNRICILAGKPIDKEAVPYDTAEYTVRLNLAGNGSKTCELSTPWSSEKSAYTDINTLFDRTTYEVVSISGTVQEY